MHSGESKSIEEFKRKGIDPNSMFEILGEKTTALIQALLSKDRDLAFWLIKNIDKRMLNEFKTKKGSLDEFKENPLMIAIDHCDKEMVEALLNAGADPAYNRVPQYCSGIHKGPIFTYAWRKWKELGLKEDGEGAKIIEIIHLMFRHYKEPKFNPEKYPANRGPFDDSKYDLRSDDLPEQKSHFESIVPEINSKLKDSVKKELKKELVKLNKNPIMRQLHGERINALLRAFAEAINLKTIENIIRNQKSLGSKSSFYLHSSILDPRFSRSFKKLNSKLIAVLDDALKMIHNNSEDKKEEKATTQTSQSGVFGQSVKDKKRSKEEKAVIDALRMNAYVEEYADKTKKSKNRFATYIATEGDLIRLNDNEKVKALLAKDPEALKRTRDLFEKLKETAKSTEKFKEMEEALKKLDGINAPRPSNS